MTMTELCSVCGSVSTLKCSTCGQACYCSKSCQKKDWKSHKKYCISFSIQEISGKGRGLVARKIIKSGELIFKEKTEIVLKLEEVKEENMNNIFKSLKEENQTKFNNLKAKNDLEASPTKSAIFYNNAINIDEFQYGLFLTIAMVNHSCVPNAVWGSTDQAETLELRSTQDISTGTEITVNYIGDKCLLMSPGERNKLLADTWGFSCSCEACENDTDVSLRNLLNMLEKKMREKLCLSKFQELFKLHTQKVLAVRRMKALNHQEILNCLQVNIILAVFSNQSSDTVKTLMKDWKLFCESDGLIESWQTYQDIERSFKNGFAVHKEEFFDDANNVRNEWLSWIYSKL